MDYKDDQYQKIQEYLSKESQWLLGEELRIKYAIPGNVKISLEPNDPLWETVRFSLQRIPEFFLRDLAEINFASSEYLKIKCISIDPEVFGNKSPNGIFERRDGKGYITINSESIRDNLVTLQRTLYHEIGHSLYLNLKYFCLDSFEKHAVKDWEANPDTDIEYRNKIWFNSPEEIFCRAFCIWMMCAPELTWVEFYKDKYF